MRREVYIIVEGQTESAVLNNTVAPHLSRLGVDIYPKIVGKPGHKGGNKPFEVVLKEAVNLCRQDGGAAISTFFDYYKIGADWPGVAEAKAAKTAGADIGTVASVLDRELARSFAAAVVPLGRPITFIPHVQMHELEALLFADTKVMAEVFLNPALERFFASIRDQAGGCEKINNNPEQSPAYRISAVYPGYQKGRKLYASGEFRAHAPRITAQTGLETIRSACPLFGQWLTRLEELAPTTAA